MKRLTDLTLACALLGATAGLALSGGVGARGVRDGLRAVEDIGPDLPVDPFRGLERVEALAHARTARDLLAEGRPWAAWKTLEPFVRRPREADPQVVLLAARAAAGWTGWLEVRTLLRDQPWLSDEGDGEGWYLLGRAEEGGAEWAHAATAYASYLSVASRGGRAEAYARLGSVRARAGDARGAAQAYRGAAALGGPASDWFLALAAESDGAPASDAAFGPAARVRAARAVATRLSTRGDSSGAAAVLAREAAVLADEDPAAAAALHVTRGALMLKRDPAEARVALLRALSAEDAAPTVRARAAAMLGELGGVSAEQQLLRAAAYEAAGKPGQAARALRAALRGGAGDTPEQRLRLGRLLWDAVDLEPARAALLDAAERLPDAESRAEAELLAARALARTGKRDEAIVALKRVAQRYEGTPAGGAAWYYLGDLSSTVELGVANYRRAASSTSPVVDEALWRLGDRLRRDGDEAGAAAAWGRIAAGVPGSPIAPRAGYEAGRIHERAGRTDAAAAAYRAAIGADPVSYYAIRAADRLGADPLAAPLGAPIPWRTHPDDDDRVAAALARLDALAAADLEEAWTEELDAQQRALDDRPAALLALAEGLRDRGRAVPGIRIGRALLGRSGRWDERLLRLVFPLPFRSVLEREAGRADVDPFLLAGLVRQESSFNPLARSRVGATGLAQVMPSTGEWLASSAGVRSFRTHHLTVPEVALRMGARYLRDQLRRYRGRRDLALAAYNAGPGRADVWRRELGGGDIDAFREAIPFDETREYVKVVIRNAEVYRRLYGRPGAGLVHDR